MKLSKNFGISIALIACVASFGLTAFAAHDTDSVGSFGTAYVNVPSRTRATATTEANANGVSSSDYVAAGFNAYTWGGGDDNPVSPDSYNDSVSYDGVTFNIVKNTGTNYTDAEAYIMDGMSIEYVNSYHAIQRNGVTRVAILTNVTSG